MPVPVFCCFCISEKLYRKYSRNWTKQKPKFLFYRNEDGARRRDGEEPRGGHTKPRRWPGQAAPRGGGPTSCTASRRLFAYKLPPDLKLTEEPASIHEKFRRGRHRRKQVSGDRSLCSGTLPGRGIAPGAISIDSTAIFIAVADSHDEEGVVLPRG